LVVEAFLRGEQSSSSIISLLARCPKRMPSEKTFVCTMLCLNWFDSFWLTILSATGQASCIIATSTRCSLMGVPKQKSLYTKYDIVKP
jgi:hypothetical protein